MAKAKLREARREETLRRVAAKAPEAPKGMLASFQRKSHQQAIAAWDSAKLAAGRLVRQARGLVERVRQAASAERVLEWARGVVERTWPGELDQLEASRGKPVQEKEASHHRPRASLAKLDLKRFEALCQAAARQPLRLADQQELVKGWDQVAGFAARGMLSFAGGRATPADLELVEQQRQAAHRRLACTVFQDLPRLEGVRLYPKLAAVYDRLEQEDRAIDASGESLDERVLRHKQIRTSMAASIAGDLRRGKPERWIQSEYDGRERTRGREDPER